MVGWGSPGYRPRRQVVNTSFLSMAVAGWVRTAGDLWLCSCLGDLDPGSCFLTLRPDSRENLLSESWALPHLILTSSQPVDGAA